MFLLEKSESAGIMSGKKPYYMPTRVAIVEDNEGTRSSLACLLERARDFQVVGSYADAESALKEVPSRNPDVVLMDINLPGMDGVECVRRLRSTAPGVQIIMLTVYADGNHLFNALMAGATGYLLKRCAPDKLLAGIKEVHEGGAPMTPEIARRVIQHFRAMPKVASSNPVKLTPRERDILEQLANGFRYKEIVDNLDISDGTLHSHIARIYRKFHVHSRTEAVVKYLNS